MPTFDLPEICKKCRYNRENDICLEIGRDREDILDRLNHYGCKDFRPLAKVDKNLLVKTDYLANGTAIISIGCKNNKKKNKKKKK